MMLKVVNIAKVNDDFCRKKTINSTVINDHPGFMNPGKIRWRISDSWPFLD